jgi:isopentenyldiphosphate isomerase
MEEILDLVNEADEVIGQVSRTRAWAERLPVRFINAFVVNSSGQLWIPRRAASKSMFPNCLDMSVGGHVISGETYLEAFKRETLEEIGVDVDTLEWREIAYFSPFETTLSAFMCVYEIRLEHVALNPDDFSEAFWMTPLELQQRIVQGEAVKGDLEEILERIYGRFA